ncbi:MAG: ABC transporter substrate-binding protein, partial [Sporichthya sp.]|nr:ABC transporter substrate-binding protein [Sporichthya sp.]
MKNFRTSRVLAAAPLALSLALVLSACGGGSDDAANSAQQDPGAVTDSVGAATDTAGAATGTTGTADVGAAPVAGGAAETAPVAGAAETAPVAGAASGAKGGKATTDKSGGAASTSTANTKGLTSIDSAAQAAENAKIAASKGGATDIGVTKDEIK